MMNLVEATRDKRLEDAVVVRTIASRPDAGGIAKIKAEGLPCEVVNRKDFGEDFVSFSKAVFSHLHRDEVDLICMCGWMHLLDVPHAWDARVLNIHPALLPKYGGQGMYGRRVHDAVVAAGEKQTGCTVHLVDEGYDTGPTILQHLVGLDGSENAEQVEAKVQAVERIAYPWGINRWRELAEAINAAEG